MKAPKALAVTALALAGAIIPGNQAQAQFASCSVLNCCGFWVNGWCVGFTTSDNVVCNGPCNCDSDCLTGSRCYCYC